MNSTGSGRKVGRGNWFNRAPVMSHSYRRRQDPGMAPGRPPMTCPAQWTRKTTTRPWGSSVEEPGSCWEGPHNEESFGLSSDIAGRRLWQRTAQQLEQAFIGALGSATKMEVSDEEKWQRLSVRLWGSEKMMLSFPQGTPTWSFILDEFPLHRAKVY